MKYLAVLLFTCTSFVAACTSNPTGSICPTASAPTYASFGQQFFATYCTGCHSRDAANRHGAPGDQNYDTEADIKQHLDDIDTEAAAGPKARNTDMPDMSGPVRMQPTTAEREQLGQFLACEKSGS